jgi:hypothetical protein
MKGESDKNEKRFKKYNNENHKRGAGWNVKVRS